MTYWDHSVLNDVLQEINFRDKCPTVALSRIMYNTINGLDVYNG